MGYHGCLAIDNVQMIDIQILVGLYKYIIVTSTFDEACNLMQQSSSSSSMHSPSSSLESVDSKSRVIDEVCQPVASPSV